MRNEKGSSSLSLLLITFTCFWKKWFFVAIFSNLVNKLSPCLFFCFSFCLWCLLQEKIDDLRAKQVKEKGRSNFCGFFIFFFFFSPCNFLVLSLFLFADHSYSGQFSFGVFSEVSEMFIVKVAVLSWVWLSFFLVYDISFSQGKLTIFTFLDWWLSSIFSLHFLPWLHFFHILAVSFLS